MAEESKLAEKLDEKNKFTQEELDEVKSIRDTYDEIQFKLGQTSITEIRLQQQLDDLMVMRDKLRDDFRNNQNTERELLETINKKYGVGELDIETGIFHPFPDK